MPDWSRQEAPCREDPPGQGGTGGGGEGGAKQAQSAAEAAEKREAEGAGKADGKRPPSTEPDAKAQKNFTDPIAAYEEKDGLCGYTPGAVMEKRRYRGHDVTQSAVDCREWCDDDAIETISAASRELSGTPAMFRGRISRRWRTATSMLRGDGREGTRCGRSKGGSALPSRSSGERARQAMREDQGRRAPTTAAQATARAVFGRSKARACSSAARLREVAPSGH